MEDVPNFCRFVTIATTPLAVSLANRRQRRCVMGAMLKKQASYVWGRDFWEVIVNRRTVD